MSDKSRLDALLVARGLAADVDEARRFIGAGLVRVDQHLADKAGTQITAASHVEVKTTRRYVSRGGDKLETALQAFDLNPDGFICADIGASTGGFTDCLLQHGATRIYSVDVGYGLLAWKLRSDPRVIVRERINARYLTKEHIPESLNLAVVDASFISVTLLLPPLFPFFSDAIRLLVLVKPQFQLARDKVAEGGVVHNHHLRHEAVSMVRSFAEGLGLRCAQPFACPVTGTKGNEEFFLYLTGNIQGLNS
ncbi:MAG: TlyA family RNA methyltransferase [Desulfobulbaceae bacterium]|nr:TlyA family RNA methyltransferase [Desulfobulbaceae bacterium]